MATLRPTRSPLVMIVLLFAVAHGRVAAPSKPKSPAGTGRLAVAERHKELSPLPGVPEVWKERLRVCRRKFARCLEFLMGKSNVYVAVALLSRIVYAHSTIQLEKRMALQAFRRLVKAHPAHYDITIITTAALPWKTGTAVNALLRAAYLADLGHTVTLVVPWIHPEEQKSVYPERQTFSCPAAQEAAMRLWLKERGGHDGNFGVLWYPARFDITRGSILPIGDPTKFCGDGKRDLCVLEEPEHLNWYHSGRNWRRQFKLVIGIAHTNYIKYATMYQPENVFIVHFINTVVCRAYCDQIVKLSDCLQWFPRTSVCNVHGVRDEFVDEGRRRSQSDGMLSTEGAYFIGKCLWAKGHRFLIDYLADETPKPGEFRTRVDVYGDGEDRPEVERQAKEAGLDLHFMGGQDHADEALRGYKVFVNPSQTEVLSTTTAEALAMGKFVIIERLPENEFFYQFGNALVYSTPEEFRALLKRALAETPAPLTEAESFALSWGGGTERFLASVTEAAASARAPTLLDELTHVFHMSISAGNTYIGDCVRKFVLESGPVSRQRWLFKERRWRRCTDPKAIVEKSVSISPPLEENSWAERYSGESSSWTSVFLWLPTLPARLATKVAMIPVKLAGFGRGRGRSRTEVARGSNSSKEEPRCGDDVAATADRQGRSWSESTR